MFIIHVDKEEEEQVKASENINTCPACLGLLQLNHEAIATKAFQLFKVQNYVLQNPNFVISHRLPPQLSIRQHAFNEFLAHSFPMYDFIS